MRVLLVEDNPGDARLVREVLTEAGPGGFELTHVMRLAEALERLSQGGFDVVLSDLGLPDSEGLDTFRRLRNRAPTMPIVVLTGSDNEELGITAVQEGAQDYLAKGQVDGRLLGRSLRYAVARQQMAKLFQLRTILEETVSALAMTIGLRDPYTAGHQRRVARLACAIAEKLGFSEDARDGLRLGATIHDVGKMSIPIDILTKPGRLEETELALVRTHCQLGYNVLKDIDFPWPVPQMALQHHERLDGSGYPQGLSGEGIIKEARVLGVADVVEAMASHRPYRPALGIDKALEEIAQNRGVLYDPKVVDACLGLSLEQGFWLVEND